MSKRQLVSCSFFVFVNHLYSAQINNKLLNAPSYGAIDLISLRPIEPLLEQRQFHHFVADESIV